MTVLRRIFLLVALAFLGWDIWSATDGGVMLVDLGKRWHAINSTSLQMTEAGISRHVSQWLWDHVVLWILLRPAFLVFFAPWLALSFLAWVLGRRRRMEEW